MSEVKSKTKIIRALRFYNNVSAETIHLRCEYYKTIKERFNVKRTRFAKPSKTGPFLFFTFELKK